VVNDPKTIAVLLDESPASQVRLGYAMQAAATFDSHLVGIFVELPPRARDDDAAAFGFARGAGMDAAIDRYLAARREAVAMQSRMLSSGALAHGYSSEWRTVSADASRRDVALHAAYCDLMFLGPPNARFDESPWSAADLVLASGVPGIVIPESASGDGLGRRIVLAWNASRVSRRAAGDAMPFLRRAESVTILVVDPRVGPGHHGEDPGADIAQLLARHKVKAAVDSIISGGRDIDAVILDHAQAVGADLLVAGAYGHSRLVELILGSTTSKLLETARLPVLIAH
jgi:nucleotide-binding universal stress UspA family protein